LHKAKERKRVPGGGRNPLLPITGFQEKSGKEVFCKTEKKRPVLPRRGRKERFFVSIQKRRNQPPFVRKKGGEKKKKKRFSLKVKRKKKKKTKTVLI